jgi:subtilisin-like proprotein convertase family protein
MVPDDPLFANQWYLRNTGQNGTRRGIDLNVVRVWDDYTGRGVGVAVLDSGVDHEHPDLAANYDDTRDASPLVTGGPRRTDGGPHYGDAHGTAAASLIGAEADNGVGMAGAAPGATVTSIGAAGWARSAFSEAKALGKMLEAAAPLDIATLSIGPNFNLRAGIPYLTAAVEERLEEGRDGLGGLVFWAAGNGRVGEQGGDQTIAWWHLNIRGEIVVAATGPDGAHADYSSWGPNVFVTAPSAAGFRSVPGIVAADITGPDGYKPGNYVSDFGGTSAATPLAAAVGALILEANPLLGWRDVQDILALSSRRIDGPDPDWTFNGADHFNGGGLHWSRDYGFGLVDARAAVRLAESWQGPAATSANDAAHAATLLDPAPVRLGELRQTVELDAPDGFRLQHLELSLKLQHRDLSDLTIRLTSPAGTTIRLLERFDESFPVRVDFEDVSLVNGFWGEEAAGRWTLAIRDHDARGDGTLDGWRIRAWGDRRPDADDTYVFTDEFATLARADRARGRLSDDAGIDTLNAAAVTGDLRLDLRPGAWCRIGEGPLRIGAETGIENAWCGDGDDVAIGNGLANALHGARGADRLNGLGGADGLFGGDGRDVLNGGRGDDILAGGAAPDLFVFRAGQDRLTDFQLGLDTLRVGDDELSTTGEFLAYDGAETSLDGDRFVLDFGAGGMVTIDDFVA